MNIRKHRFYNKNARILFLIPGILLLCFFQQCSKKKEHKVSTAFYYWKTNFHLNADEKAVLKETKTSTIYLRFFDVDWNRSAQKAQPVGILQYNATSEKTHNFIPVVYITQSCLQKIAEKDLPELSANISSLITNLCTKYNIDPKEIQIDCDWTKKASTLYFSLLKHLKSSAFFQDKLLSCTIRLHQIKYMTSSGIPPVDKGLLMVYNMGNLTRYGGQNSILDVEAAREYLKHLTAYPLPLDIAIPVYHWAALFEDGRFKGITYNILKLQFADDMLQQKEDNLYQILQDSDIGGYRFRKGQEIRFEKPDKKSLVQIGNFISKNIRDTAFRISFFHLDSRSMKPFDIKDLNEIVRAFK